MRWLRLLLSALFLAAVQLGGMGAAAAKTPHTCDGMSMSAGLNMDDCHGKHGGDYAAVPDCAGLVCAMAQTILPPHEAFTARLAPVASAPLPLRDDFLRRGLSGPPDLRPPIG